MMGNSSVASSAPSSMNRSKTALSTSAGRASGRSILLMTTIGFSPAANALRKTKRVCGSGPSAASTSRKQPSAIFRTRSTSPPKSAWPGVSIRLTLVAPSLKAMFLARMVMPRWRSSSLESRMHSWASSDARNSPDCLRIWSTSVVLPWSTWAMIATLRRSVRCAFMPALLVRGCRVREERYTILRNRRTPAMPTLYLIRHAEAVPHGDPGYADDDRPLTDEGRRDARALGAALAARGIIFDVVLSSPLPRARTTAQELIAGMGGPAPPLEFVDELAPDAKSRKLDRRLLKYDASAIALVGHQPDLGQYAGRLIGSKKAAVLLDKPGVACVACDEPPGKGCGELVWLVTRQWFQPAVPEPPAEEPALYAG